jgi:rRNA processing protein Krr1/Pno1
MKVSESIMIPASVRSHIVGKQGVTLKNIIAKTGTSIQVDKYDTNGAINDEDEIVVTITGTLGAIQEAKQEIDQIVAQRVFF